MTKKQALNYLKSSGFSKEQIKAVVDALQGSPTKNDLVVDCISRQQAQTEIEMNASRYTIARERGGIGQVEWSDQLIKVSDAVNIIRNLLPVTPQEPQSFKWCTDCKEYNQEKHCCYRYSKVIRDTVEEIEQDPRKGEWLRMSDLSEQEDDRYKCSRCGNVIHHKNKMDLYTFNSWCGRCGSDNGRHINYEVEE